MGPRRVGAGIPDLADLGLRLVAHEVLLEVEPAVGAEDARPDRLVGHRQHGGPGAEAAWRRTRWPP